MSSQESTVKRSRWLPVRGAVVVGGWVATAAVWWLSPGWEADPSRGWGARTLAVAVLVSAVMAVTVSEAVRTWRRRPERLRPLDVAWMFLGTCIWLLGGLLTALDGLLSGEDCSGTGGLSSFGCLNRPGQGLSLLGWLLTLSTTGVLAIMYWSGRRSWVAAALAPALIIGLYMLAAALWQAHIGFGVPHRHVMP